MTNASEKPAQTRLQRAWPKLLGLAIWLAVLIAYWQHTRSSGITPLEVGVAPGGIHGQQRRRADDRGG